MPERTSHLGLTNLKPGQTIVMMATEDSTRCYAVGDDLTPNPVRPAQFVAAAECLPSAQPEPLPGNTNQRVNAAAELFQQDLTRILGNQRRRTGGNALNRRFIRRQLNGVAEDIATSTTGRYIATGLHRRPAHNSGKRNNRAEKAQPCGQGVSSLGWNCSKKDTASTRQTGAMKKAGSINPHGLFVPTACSNQGTPTNGLRENPGEWTSILSPEGTSRPSASLSTAVQIEAASTTVKAPPADERPQDQKSRGLSLASPADNKKSRADR